MASRDAHVKWLDSGDPKQMQWVRQYLLKIGTSFPSQSDKAVISWITTHPNNAEFRETLDLMRAAWRQKKYRDKRSGRKAYNFMLSISTQANLKHISSIRKTSITAALEQLITDALDAEKRHKKELKTLEGEQKEKLAEMKTGLDEAKKKGKEQLNHISELAKAAKELAAEVTKQLRNVCELKFPIATEDDKAELDQICLDELEEIKKRLLLPQWLDAFSPRPYIHKPPKG